MESGGPAYRAALDKTVILRHLDGRAVVAQIDLKRGLFAPAPIRTGDILYIPVAEPSANLGIYQPSPKVDWPPQSLWP